MPRSPRISGLALTQLARVARSKVGGLAIQRLLRADMGVDALARVPDSLRGDVPLDTRPHPGRPPRQARAEHQPRMADQPGGRGGWAPDAAAFTAAYAAGRTTPREVLERVLDEARRLATLRPTVGPMLDLDEEAARRDADASTKRWKQGQSRGPLDGVPWVVKEECAVRGLPRRSGTTFIDAAPQAADATAVERLRAEGAITVGTTPMTELGMTPNGANQKRAMPRNPHDTSRFAGGSSTGSGVAVATGLVPFALGVDGGGSIRIPAAMNGVFGIKPTWGRVSRSGDAATGTVAHLGPIAGSTGDLARALDVMSGPDGKDPQTFAAPKIDSGEFVGALGRGVRGLVVGVPESEWAVASGPVAEAGRAALAALEKAGATLVPVKLELAHLAPAIGVVVIACEARASVSSDWRDRADEMSPDLQIVFSALDTFGAVEYLEATRLRTGLRREIAGAFRQIDLLALPSTVGVASAVSEVDMETGFLDTSVIDGLCRFAFLANLTGLPALSAPVGRDAQGLPIGLQLVGDAWDEATVLAASAHLERIGVAACARPRITASVLG